MEKICGATLSRRPSRGVSAPVLILARRGEMQGRIRTGSCANEEKAFVAADPKCGRADLEFRLSSNAKLNFKGKLARHALRVGRYQSRDKFAAETAALPNISSSPSGLPDWKCRRRTAATHSTPGSR